MYFIPVIHCSTHGRKKNKIKCTLVIPEDNKEKCIPYILQIVMGLWSYFFPMMPEDLDSNDIHSFFHTVSEWSHEEFTSFLQTLQTPLRDSQRDTWFNTRAHWITISLWACTHCCGYSVPLNRMLKAELGIWEYSFFIFHRFSFFSETLQIQICV